MVSKTRPTFVIQCTHALWKCLGLQHISTKSGLTTTTLKSVNSSSVMALKPRKMSPAVTSYSESFVQRKTTSTVKQLTKTKCMLTPTIWNNSAPQLRPYTNPKKSIASPSARLFNAFQGRFQQIFKAANDKTGGRSDRRTLLNVVLTGIPAWNKKNRGLKKCQQGSRGHF